LQLPTFCAGELRCLFHGDYFVSLGVLIQNGMGQDTSRQWQSNNLKGITGLIVWL